MIRFLYGENAFALDEAVRAVRSAYLEEHDAFGLEVLDGEDVLMTKVQVALLQMPFLVSKKLVILRSVFANKQLIEGLHGLLEQVPDEIDVLLCDVKPDKRTRLYKYLDKQIDAKQFLPLDMPRLITWVKSFAESQGFTLNDTLTRQLIERSGTDQYRLSHDIEVLALQSQPIDKTMVDELVQPTLNSTVFQLLEIAFRGNAERSIALYNELLLQKVDPSEIIAMIGWQLHIYALIKTAGNRAPADIAKAGKVHPFVVSKSITTAKQMSATALRAMVSKTLEADLTIKTSSGNAEDVGKLLILELSELISS